MPVVHDIDMKFDVSRQALAASAGHCSTEGQVWTEAQGKTKRTNGGACTSRWHVVSVMVLVDSAESQTIACTALPVACEGHGPT